MIYMTTILQHDGGQTCRDTKKTLLGSHESYSACRMVQTDLPNAVAGLNLRRDGGSGRKF